VSQPTDPRIGTTIGGYRIESLIGRGGMSVVYLAEDAHLHRRVALKFLAPELVADEKFQERFVRESRLAASLEHPNIVTVYDAREADGQLYLAMRYVAGTDLKRLIAAEGPFDPARTISIIAQAASALDAANAEGLIHRDVKPGNILIAPRTSPDGRDRVYLADFGLTKRASSDSGITATGQFVGTLDYAAPEQFEGRTLDGRADVYSLGCVLYECLTGEVPFPRENQAALVYAHLNAPPPKVTTLRPELPPAIDAVVARAMAKQADDRYATAGELAAAAADALGVQAVAPVTPSTPVPRGAPAGSRPSRNRVVAIGAGVVVLALVIGVVVANRGNNGPVSPTASNSFSTGPASEAVVDYVARIDPATGRILARIPIGTHPVGIAVGEGSAWVLDRDGSVRRIDPVTNTVVVIDGVAQDPQDIAAGEGGVWVADGIKGQIRKIDPASNTLIASIPVGGVTYAVVAGGGGVWVNTLTGIIRVDPENGSVHPIPVPGSVGGNSGRFLSAQGGGFVWVASALVGSLFRGDISSGIVDMFHIGVVPRSLSVTGDDVWVAACGTPGTVVRVDAHSGELVSTIAAGGAICPNLSTAGTKISIAATADGAWVTDGFNGTVSQIGGVTNQVGAPIRIGDYPVAIAVGLGSVWVTVDGEDQEVSPSPSTS
jgi:serine/threonine-protein kinase